MQAVAALVASAERPVLFAGGDVYWGHAEGALVAFAETANVPVFVNGMGRGTIPADHALAFSRARSIALREADLVLVAGTPLDFRLGFGRFGDAQVVHLCDTSAGIGRHAVLAASTGGDLATTFTALTDAVSSTGRTTAWVARLRDEEQAKRAAEAGSLADERSPIRPTRIYGELRARRPSHHGWVPPAATRNRRSGRRRPARSVTSGRPSNRRASTASCVPASTATRS